MQLEDNSLTQQVFNFICDFSAEHGFGPTQREIAEGCYISRSNVVRYLDQLEWQRCITREPGKARSIKVIRDCGCEPKSGQMSSQMPTPL